MILPQQFIDSLKSCKGFDENSFLEAHRKIPAVSVIVNPLKVNSKIACFQDLISDHIPWCEHGIYLRERPIFTLDPLLHAGAYYVQEASSMFLYYLVENILPAQENLKALDLCASPGGKSTLLASMKQFDLILSNEIISTRLPALNENIVKWGSVKSLISNNDPKDFQLLGEIFDVVLVDAPCSGSGLFRKDPDALDEWSQKHVDFCAVRQQRILNDAIAVLKPGGYLIYSTCSFSSEENEENVDFLLNTDVLHSVEVPIPDNWGVVKTLSDKNAGNGYRFYPDRLKGEGFFCSVFQKTHTTSTDVRHSNLQQQQPFKRIGDLHEWVKPEHLSVFNDNGILLALHEKNADMRNVLKQGLRLRKSGIKLGSFMKKGFVPDHELALSELLADHVRSIDLSKTDAIRYLRKEDVETAKISDGICLVTYQQLALGWSKIIRNRLKNNYPLAYRILLQGDGS
jgi:16S rRNA C967 or C1407 C5-methylase (RsmB/RsmF family)/NOL1/NOP2/fmu family ribosome biogenesis protein